MSLYSRSLIVATAGLALVGLSACSGGSTGGGEQPQTSAAQSSGLADFDVCNFFTAGDLSAFGVQGPGEPDSTIDTEPGCNFRGDVKDVTLYKVPDTAFDAYTKQGNFGSLTPYEIDGRKAANGVTKGSEGQGICSAFLDAGGGTVIVTVTGLMRDSVADPCGEAEKVARQIEPRLPE
ncbi:Protein of unknown function [Saccharopolyspora antimicrobica]|uniref:Uncharacterized protein DUF3558 n=1 Tax=Saccharopolyspora antimicrobica TaxID=455193 RepID=A0A1I5A6K4_9PSEU|nr:uncharacterized protein DUF3558 [Saccharopolyspora antimicrobica]SFN58067.1 Protein of unknown function [Saccharopolyspora antimicrobica]